MLAVDLGDGYFAYEVSEISVRVTLNGEYIRTGCGTPYEWFNLDQAIKFKEENHRVFNPSTTKEK
jgi:hypothetical protein